MLERTVDEMINNYLDNMGEKEDDDFLEEVIEFLMQNGVSITDIKNDYDSIDCGLGYTAHVYSLAWLDDDGIHLLTWRVEYC